MPEYQTARVPECILSYLQHPYPYPDSESAFSALISGQLHPSLRSGRKGGERRCTAAHPSVLPAGETQVTASLAWSSLGGRNLFVLYLQKQVELRRFVLNHFLVVSIGFSDFVPQPPKSGFNTVRLEQVPNHCFSRHARGTTMGRIFFGF